MSIDSSLQFLDILDFHAAMCYHEKNSMNTSSSRIRVNAAISYCFLAPLFLLAGNNPAYAESFVREHSWRALKLQGALLGYYVFSLSIL
jgi:hypothetical protein